MNGSLLSKVKSTIMTLAAVLCSLGRTPGVDALPGGPWKKRRREKTTNGFKAQWM